MGSKNFFVLSARGNAFTHEDHREPRVEREDLPVVGGQPDVVYAGGKPVAQDAPGRSKAADRCKHQKMMRRFSPALCCHPVQPREQPYQKREVVDRAFVLHASAGYRLRRG